MTAHDDPHRQGDFPSNPLVVYRALPYENLLQKRTSGHKDKVFHRHPTRDENGISVTSSIKACKAQFSRRLFGIRRIDVAALRAYGLELFPTSDTHANLRFADGSNIPIPRGQDELVAKQIAEDLMKMSDVVTHWDAENADDLESELLNSN